MLQLVGLKVDYFPRLMRQRMVVLTWGVVFRGCRSGQSVLQRGGQSRFPEGRFLEKQEVSLKTDQFS